MSRTKWPMKGKLGSWGHNSSKYKSQELTTVLGGRRWDYTKKKSSILGEDMLYSLKMSLLNTLHRSRGTDHRFLKPCFQICLKDS